MALFSRHDTAQRTLYDIRCRFRCIYTIAGAFHTEKAELWLIALACPHFRRAAASKNASYCAVLISRPALLMRAWPTSSTIDFIRLVSFHYTDIIIARYATWWHIISKYFSLRGQWPGRQLYCAQLFRQNTLPLSANTKITGRYTFGRFSHSKMIWYTSRAA